MPTRGYRKGISDTKHPMTCSVRTHIADNEFAKLKQCADDRSLTLSKFMRQMIQANLTGTRLKTAQPQGPAKRLLREVARVGNNLNQLARQANTGMVEIRAGEIRPALAAVLDVMRRI